MPSLPPQHAIYISAMSTSICSSCLARAQIIKHSSLSTSRTHLNSSFHSSAKLQNVVAKKKTIIAKPKLRVSTHGLVKKKKGDRPKPPPVGQRALERKRIVLSNTNALEVENMDKLSTETMADESKTGHVLTLEGPLLDQLREAKAFKRTQNWNLFRNPSTLQRKESIQIGMDVNSVNESLKDGQTAKTYHRLIVGEKASGKSVHLLQAMSMAYLNKWIVINVPDGQEYIYNQSAYAPVPKEGEENSETMYTQPQLASDLLTRLVNSNDGVLADLKIVHQHDKSLSNHKLDSVKDLALLGTNNRILSSRVWDAVWKELTVPAQDQKDGRPPLLLAIDGINFWMGQTRYRSPDFKFIHAHQFTLVKQLLDLVFSKNAESLSFGGIVMACTTKSNHPNSPAFDLLVRQITATQNGTALTDPSFPLGDPYTNKPDPRVSNLFDPSIKTTVTELKGLSRPESRGLLEYFAKSGIFKSAVDDTVVSEKWTLSGGGIVGQLCKIGAFARTGMFQNGPREATKSRV